MIIWSLALYVMSRLEVTYAVLTRSVTAKNTYFPDRMPADRIPSVALGNTCDRVLADVDREGFLFATDARDEAVFNRRSESLPRVRNQVQLVLSSGSVCVQKRRLAIQCQRPADRIREAIGYEFYVEAAALLRLRGLPSVPALRRIDLRERMIEMEYIWGEDLYHCWPAANGIPYDAVTSAFLLALQDATHDLSVQIMNLLQPMKRRGVIPRDIHPANFIRGCRSRKLYMVDFQVVHLWPVPGWHMQLQKLDSLFIRRA